MSDFNENLRTALLANAGVASALGGRLTLIAIPQNPTYPCAAFQRVSTVPMHTLDQANVQWSKLRRGRVQFSVFDTDAARGSAAASAIENGMKTVNLTSTGATQAPNRLLLRREQRFGESQVPVFMTILDFETYFNEVM